jgi:hypothetical protein
VNNVGMADGLVNVDFEWDRAVVRVHYPRVYGNAVFENELDGDLSKGVCVRCDTLQECKKQQNEPLRHK